MNAALESLMRAAAAAGVDLDVERARDAIWLALRARERTSLDADEGEPGPTEQVDEEADLPARDDERERSIDEPRRADAPSITDSSDSRESRESGNSSRPAARVPLTRGQVRADAPLEGSRTLAGALRPLRLRRASKTRLVLDEDATIERVAEEQVWSPVFRPELERFLEVDLVVDGSTSMLLWRRVARELSQVLHWSGAFRSIRSWWLDVEGDELRLHASSADLAHGRRPRALREVGGHGHPSLVLIVSDCIAPAWRQAPLARALERWCRTRPVGLLQVLPQSLWSRTALRPRMDWFVRAHAPALPNGRMAWRGGFSFEKRTERSSARVPVASLDADSVVRLARLFAGRAVDAGEGWLDGAAFDLQPFVPPAARATSRAAPSAADRVRAFWNASSATAYRLAVLLASSPFATLEGLRRLRGELLPAAGPREETEVVFGGLVRMGSPSDARYTDDEDVHLTFHDGVREELLVDAQLEDTLRVLELADTIGRERGYWQRSFREWLLDPEADLGPEELESDERSYLTVASDVLVRFGGKYARLADTARETIEVGASASEEMSEEPEWRVEIAHRLQHADVGLVGRGKELALVRGWWATDVELCEILGPEGSGKSTFVSAFLRELATAPLEGHVLVWSLSENDSLADMYEQFAHLFSEPEIPDPKVVQPLTQREQFVLENVYGWGSNPPRTHHELSEILNSTIDGIYRTQVEALAKLSLPARHLLVLDDADRLWAEATPGIPIEGVGIRVLATGRTRSLAPVATPDGLRPCTSIQLGPLEPADAAHLLRSLGVTGSAEALDRVLSRMERSPLSLTSLAQELNEHQIPIDALLGFDSALDSARGVTHALEQVRSALARLMFLSMGEGSDKWTAIQLGRSELVTSLARFPRQRKELEVEISGIWHHLPVVTRDPNGLALLWLDKSLDRGRFPEMRWHDDSDPEPVSGALLFGQVGRRAFGGAIDWSRRVFTPFEGQWDESLEASVLLGSPIYAGGRLVGLAERLTKDGIAIAPAERIRRMIDGKSQPASTSLEITEIQVDGYEYVVRARDGGSGLHAIIAIHDTTLGPALGGLRLFPYASEDEALYDALRLSKGMTYKSAIAETGLGGGKAVVIGDPKDVKSEALFRAFGRFVDSLDGRYITAEDMNITVEDLEFVRQETRWVVGLSRDSGGSGNPSPYTARGCIEGMRAVLESLHGSPDFEGRHVVVQGAGSVGAALAQRLVEEGARVSITDINPSRINDLVEQFGVTAIENDELFDVECDIYSPNAFGATINDDSIPRLRCRAIAGAANNQLLEPRHAEELQSRGILYAPDFVLNAGGLINVAAELEPGGYDEDVVIRKLGMIRKRLSYIFQLAREQEITTTEAAKQVAEERLSIGRGEFSSGSELA